MADLVTLAEAKAYSSIISTNQDAELKFLIPKASEMVKTYCGRSFIDYYSEEKQEVFNGGSCNLILVEAPLQVVSSVEYSGNYGKTYTKLVEFTDFVINKEEETIVPITVDEFPWAVNGYRVTYTAGYAGTPEDLKLAVMDLILYYQKADMSVKSTRSPGSSNSQIEYVMNAALPSHIRRVLDAYRLVL